RRRLVLRSNAAKRSDASRSEYFPARDVACRAPTSSENGRKANQAPRRSPPCLPSPESLRVWETHRQPCALRLRRAREQIQIPRRQCPPRAISFRLPAREPNRRRSQVETSRPSASLRPRGTPAAACFLLFPFPCARQGSP